jgi:hypothetical protein
MPLSRSITSRLTPLRSTLALRAGLPLLLAMGFLTFSSSDAFAATCSSNTHIGNWSNPATWTNCDADGIPDGDDTARIVGTNTVTVDSNQSAALLDFPNTSTLAFTANNPTVTVGDIDVVAGEVTGNGTVTSAGGVTTTSAISLFITNGADVILNGASTLNQGGVALQSNGGAAPSLQVNAPLTIAAGNTSPTPFGLDGGGATAPYLLISAAGSLIDQQPGPTGVGATTDNDGLVRAEAGGLTFLRGGPGTWTSTGEFEATAGDTLTLGDGGNGVNTFSLGAGASLTGPGAIQIANLVMAGAGADIDPATLEISSFYSDLVISGAGVYAPTNIILSAANGVLNSTRDASPALLDARAGTLTGNHTVTPASFTKTTAAAFAIQNGADVVLNNASTIGDGQLCLQDTGGGDPSLRLGAPLSIPSGTVFNCNQGADVPHLLLNPGGSLGMSGAGTWTINTRIGVTGGTLAVGGGQTLNLQLSDQTAGTTTVANGATLTRAGAFAQSGGTTTINAGGTSSAPSSGVTGGTLAVNGALGSPVSLSGAGTLTGTGTVTGLVANTSGTVRPGSSPGTLAISGDYTQGTAGTLAVDVDGISPETQFDVLQVSGAATLGGTLAVIQGAGFDPASTDTFQFLTSGSRTGTFDALTGGGLPSGRTYALAYPSSAPFGARLVVNNPPPPSNSAQPTISGTPVEGQTLTCNPGLWSGSPTFAFEWRREGSPIAAADSSTYTLGSEDVGRQITCRVTATNAGGSDNATSDPVTPTAKPSPEQPKPAPEPRVEPQPQPQPQPEVRCDDKTKPVTALIARNVKRRGRKLTLSGTSGDSGGLCAASGVRRVQVSLARVSGRAGVNCSFLRSLRRFQLTKPQNCRRPVLFEATGTNAWSFDFKVRLAPGKYRVQARAIDGARNKETPKKRRNIVEFTVR